MSATLIEEAIKNLYSTQLENAEVVLAAKSIQGHWLISQDICPTS